MKTAMEQALARIELLYGMKPDAIHWEMFKNDCMEKEKEQSLNLIRFMRTNDKMGKSIEDLYNEFYNQKQINK